MVRRIHRNSASGSVVVVNFDQMDADVLALGARIGTLEALTISTRLTTLESTNVSLNSRLSTIEGFNTGNLPRGIVGTIPYLGSGATGTVAITQGATQSLTGLSSSVTFQSGRRYRIVAWSRAVASLSNSSVTAQTMRIYPANSSNTGLASALHWHPARTGETNELGHSGFHYEWLLTGNGVSRQVKIMTNNTVAFHGTYNCYMDDTVMGYIEDVGAI